ncbi:NAD(P)/FAD-dependent oxidoreductase [Cytophagaceae bacterium YF14B1]|uniref:NAD(P)/FAD-dependent oxidoreductase n=1 Tax=Xanthocytophaga flava TaxID=3048013 RepID=A0AAE3QXA0_9BACT|nr:NAD(P)/FAD-dependent oxidoreductase [Xanthocytophaga flavus]MDJ1484178.1 NAD(P)/FAD-dependent oxidoreductase [Xanthocytophaga flavus]
MTTHNNPFDVLIVGGSYAGLAAAMALGRSLRNVLILDSGKPCNQQTPHSHNFLTQDGQTPASIAQKAREQVLAYDTVQLLRANAIAAEKTETGFRIQTESGNTYTSRKLIFATGLRDNMLPIDGFAECWGISVLHCPYCHGYEVANQPLGILSNGNDGYEFVKLILNWTKTLTLFTNGPSKLTTEQHSKLTAHGISIIEKEIQKLEHQQGRLQNLLFKDGSSHALTALFARAPFEQHCSLPQTLGCELSDMGFIQVNDFQQTSVAGVYAAGDATTGFRSVANAVGAGTKAGAIVNKELIEEDF